MTARATEADGGLLSTRVSLVTPASVAAARAGDDLVDVVTRLAERDPAILTHVSGRRYPGREAARDATLRAAALAHAAFLHQWGPELPRILKVDLGIWRKDHRLAPIRQPHVWAAAKAELGAHADAETLATLGGVIIALDEAAFNMPRAPWAWLPSPVRRVIPWLRSLFKPLRDDAPGIPRRLSFGTWMIGLFAFLSVYLFTFTVVHPEADTRRCMGALQDPLHDLIPLDLWWWYISVDGYTIMTLTVLGVMFVHAFLGDHRPAVRFGTGLAFVGILRAMSILLLPICRYGTPEGASRFSGPPLVDIGPFYLPWRLFASNDLVFSGHVAEVVLFLRVTRSWPTVLRFLLWVYCIAQIYALLATRGHYTVDILLAFPCTYFADRMAVYFLSYVSKHRHMLEAKKALAALAKAT